MMCFAEIVTNLDQGIPGHMFREIAEIFLVLLVFVQLCHCVLCEFRFSPRCNVEAGFFDLVHNGVSVLVGVWLDDSHGLLNWEEEADFLLCVLGRVGAVNLVEFHAVHTV